MIRFVFRFFLVFMVLILAWTAQAQDENTPTPWETGRSRAEDLEITLVTVGPGPGFSSWFGHTALGVEDKRLGIDCLYNFGMYHYHPGILVDLLFGRLRFWVGPMDYSQALKVWIRRDRDVSIALLNLSPDKRLEIAQNLAESIKPENRYYLYKYYKDNCSTRVRDLLDYATDGQFKKSTMTIPSRMNFRNHTRRFLIRPLIDYGLMFCMSHEIDRPITAWDEMFLPSELERNVLDLEYTDEEGHSVSIAASHKVVYTSKSRPTPHKKRAKLWPWMFLWGLLFSSLSFATAKMYLRGTRMGRIIFGLYQAFVGLVFGGAGSFLIFAWIFTDHTVGYHNENIFLVNPLTLAAGLLGLIIAAGKERFVPLIIKIWYVCGAIAVLGIALKILPWFYQDNYATLALLIPLLTTTVYSMRMIDKARSLPQ